jgi:hypothetical protein
VEESLPVAAGFLFFFQATGLVYLTHFPLLYHLMREVGVVFMQAAILATMSRPFGYQSTQLFPYFSGQAGCAALPEPSPSP